MIAVSAAPLVAVRKAPGEQATRIFLFGNMMVFGAFFATFMVERAKAPDIFDVARKRCTSE
ncbi:MULTISPECIES: hypothetical protein [unclassified Mycobacterium]|uniref:hypothetical protein n=1 Tax=unclassified Mycobacterium TaxID=2642494 RepID=UPI0029C78893|nr:MULTISPECIES: hypothetical protein [unclassified Mycobacterium]